MFRCFIKKRKRKIGGKKLLAHSIYSIVNKSLSDCAAIRDTVFRTLIISVIHFLHISDRNEESKKHGQSSSATTTIQVCSMACKEPRAESDLHVLNSFVRSGNK